MTNTKKYTKEIEEIVWELHGQHQADYHMEFDEDIKRDLKKSIDQLQALIDRAVREERERIKRHFETMVFDATVVDTGDTALLSEQYLDRISEFRREQSKYLSHLTDSEK